MAAQTTITETELREQFTRSGLAGRGWTFERAVSDPSILKSLKDGVISRRKTMARLSYANPATHHVEKEEAA